MALLACRTRPRAGLEPPSDEAALAGFPEGAPIRAVLETSEGPVHCELDRSHAPHAVTLFVGLANGRADWLDQHTGSITLWPLYRDLDFHRAIPHVLVQSGCPVGDSTGYPGYRIGVEASADDAQRLSTSGALFLARYTEPPGRADPHPPPPGRVPGSQFVIALGDMSHLATQVSVLGRCRDLQTLNRIAAQVAQVGTASARPKLVRISFE